jgi:hypothetical protein
VSAFTNGGSHMSHSLLLRKRLEGGKNSVGAGIDVDRREVAPSDCSLGIDYKQRPFAHAFLPSIGAIGACGFSFGLEVREKREV